MLINKDYFTFIIFFGTAFFVILLLFAITWILMVKRSGFEKLSSYECGFEPFNDARKSFNLNFYNVGLIFLIFDVELIFLLPGIACVGYLPFLGRLFLFLFILILILGFIFEIVSGALDIRHELNN